MFVEKKRSVCSQYAKDEGDFIQQEQEEDVMCLNIDLSARTKNQYRNNFHQTSASDRMPRNPGGGVFGSVEDDSYSDEDLLSAEIPNRFFTGCQNFLHGYDNYSVSRRQNDQNRRKPISYDLRDNQQDNDYEPERYRRHYRERKPHRQRQHAESYEHPRSLKPHQHHKERSSSCSRSNEYNDTPHRHRHSQQKYNALPEIESDVEYHREYSRGTKRRHEKQREGNAKFYNNFHDNDLPHKYNNRSAYNTNIGEHGEYPAARVDEREPIQLQRKSSGKEYRLSYDPTPHYSPDYPPDFAYGQSHPRRPQKIKPTLKRCFSTPCCDAAAYRIQQQNKSVDFIGLDGEIPYDIEKNRRKKSGVEERVRTLVNPSSFLMKREMVSQRTDPGSEVSRPPMFQCSVDPKPRYRRREKQSFNPVTRISLPNSLEMRPKSSKFIRNNISSTVNKLKRESKTNSECSLKQEEPAYSVHKSKSLSSITGIVVKCSKCRNNTLMNQKTKCVYPTIYRVPKSNTILHSYLQNSPCPHREKVISCSCDKVLGKCSSESSMNTVDQRYPEAFKENYEAEDADYYEIASMDSWQEHEHARRSDRSVKSPTKRSLHDTKPSFKMSRKIESDGYEPARNLIIERVCYEPEQKPINEWDFYDSAATPMGEWDCYDPARKPVIERVCYEPVPKPIERICYEPVPKPIERICYESVPKTMQRVCCETVPQTVIERVCYESVVEPQPQQLQTECNVAPTSPTTVQASTINLCLKICVGTGNLLEPAKIMATLNPEEAKSPETLQSIVVGMEEVPKSRKFSEETGQKIVCESAKTSDDLELVAKAPSLSELERCENGKGESNTFEDVKRITLTRDSNVVQSSLPNQTGVVQIELPPYKSEIKEEFYEQLWSQRRKQQDASQQYSNRVSATILQNDKLGLSSRQQDASQQYSNRVSANILQNDKLGLSSRQQDASQQYSNRVSANILQNDKLGLSSRQQDASQQYSNRVSANILQNDKVRLSKSKSELGEKYQRSYKFENCKADSFSDPKPYCRCPPEPKKPFAVPQPEFDYRPSFVEELKKELLESMRNEQQQSQLQCQCQCQCPKPQVMIYPCCPPASLMSGMCQCKVSPCPTNLGPYAAGSCQNLGPYAVGPCPGNIVYTNPQSLNNFWSPR